MYPIHPFTRLPLVADVVRVENEYDREKKWKWFIPSTDPVIYEKRAARRIDVKRQEARDSIYFAEQKRMCVVCATVEANAS